MELTGKIWTQEGFRYGSLILAEGVIEAVNFAPDSRDCPPDAPYITPGLLDLQLNGAFGRDFTEDPTGVQEVAAELPQWGVTAFLPTFITAPAETYRAALQSLANQPASAGAWALGAHFEGPFLNPQFKGAHRVECLRAPNLPEVEDWLQSGWLRFVTLAPELPGALPVVTRLAQAGVVVSVGHSGATYAETCQGLAAGIRSGTHLFNAMTPLHHRQPGVPTALLESEQTVVGVIADGIHVEPAVLKLVYRLKGWRGIALVTDAMAALGMPAGRYVLAGLEVDVDETSARLAGKSTLAGSILNLDAAIRNFVAFTGCPLHEAVAMATYTPAKLLGLSDGQGEIRAGGVANLAIFSADFRPLQTIVAGQTVFANTAKV